MCIVSCASSKVIQEKKERKVPKYSKNLLSRSHGDFKDNPFLSDLRGSTVADSAVGEVDSYKNGGSSYSSEVDYGDSSRSKQDTPLISSVPQYVGNCTE